METGVRAGEATAEEASMRRAISARSHVPRARGRLARSATALVCLVTFVVLAAAVADGAVVQVELSVLMFAADRRAPLPDIVMGVFSLIGGGDRLSFLTAVLLASLVTRGRYRTASFVGAGFVGAEALSAALKAFFDRPRPPLDHRAAFVSPDWIGEASVALVALAVVAAWRTGWRWPAVAAAVFFALALGLDRVGELVIPAQASRDSFPSGHALRSAALVASVILVLWTTRWRVSLLVTGAAFVAAVGISRVYLGLHYPSDVLGGWSVAVSVVLALSVVPFLDPIGGPAVPRGEELPVREELIASAARTSGERKRELRERQTP